MKKQYQQAKQKYFTLEQIKTILFIENRKVMKQTVIDYTACIALTLIDKLQLNSEEAKKFLDKVNELYLNICENRVNIDNIKEILREDYGIIIE